MARTPRTPRERLRKLEQERAARGNRRVNDPLASAVSAASTRAPTPTPTGGVSPTEGGGSDERGPPGNGTPVPPRTAGWETAAELAASQFKPDVEVTLTVRDTRPPERAIERRQREEREAQRELIRMCRGHTQEAVDTLAGIMRDTGQKGVARVAAAKTIIEFGHGKAQSTLNIQRVFSPEELALVAKALVEKRLAEQTGKVIEGGKLTEQSKR